ncbi:transcription factor MYB119-like isoform X1 [Oryza brachyantha]|uniref:Uncharacterized protein n=2 Tax=Oryza brachyantha TaxID=4533 RepID=J3MBJ2_ORYBR|nr:transcription factor MYB119-like isoform X1 [Oryza brachyantha]
MDFSCFQPHSGCCDDMPLDSYVQQNDHQELHLVDHPLFEGVTHGHEYYSSYAGGSFLPFATYYDLGHDDYCPHGGGDKEAVVDQASPTVHKASPHLPLFTPKSEVSHLIGGGVVGSYKAFEMNGRLIRRKKSSGKSLKKANVVKGQWTLEEDRKLVKLVQQFGLRKWSHIAQMLPGRVGKQCRERWHNHLRPNIKKDTWSEEEDIVLIQTHKEVGNKWAEIAKHLPGRTENSIKNHWNATKRRQFARRRSRASSKNPKSGTLLQNYIKSLGIGPIKSSVRLSPLEQPTVSSSPANTQKLAQVNGVRTGSNLSNQMVTQETLSMDENDDIQTNTCEEFQLLVSTYGDLCLDMCDHLFETKEEAPYQVYNIDGDDVDMNYIFNHIDYANKIGHEIEDMEMAWDDDVLELEDNESGSSPLETPAVHVKEEMDLVEMVTRTQFAASG